jgi:hypothetical protein
VLLYVAVDTLVEDVIENTHQQCDGYGGRKIVRQYVTHAMIIILVLSLYAHRSRSFVQCYAPTRT